MDGTPPSAPIVVTPGSGSRTNDTTPTYSGIAEADSTVTIVVDGNVSGTAITDGSGNWSFTPTVSLSEAAHTVKAWARDVAGNISADSPEHSFTVDTTPPGAPVVLTPASGSRTNNTTPTFSGTAEADSTVTIIVDGNNSGTAVADGSGNWSFTPTVALSEATHTVKARARDVAGTTGPDSPVHSFTVDITPPAAPVVQAPASGSRTNDTTPTYSGTAEANSTVTIVVDGNVSGTAITDGSGNWSFTPTVALSEAAHTVKAWARDGAGTTGPDSPEHSFTVDTTPPGAPVVQAPASGSLINDATPTYSGTAEEDSIVTIVVDGNNSGTAVTDGSGNWSFTPTVALSDATHTVKARARDVAGTTGPDSPVHSFTVDTTPPGAPVVLTPASGSRTNNTTPTFSGTAEADSTVTIVVDGNNSGTAVADGSGNWSFTPTVALSEATHTVKARARDVAGNISADSPEHSFTVDTTVAPPIVLTPASGSRTNDTTPTYSGTAEADSTVTIVVEGNVSGTAITDGSGNWSFTPTVALSEAAHTVKAWARDVAGNISADSPEHSFTVDTTPPGAPVVQAPASGSLINDATPTYSGTAEEDSTVTIVVDGNNSGTAVTDGSGNWSFTPTVALSDATHTVKARARDVAGTTGPDSPEHSFTVDTTVAPPIVLTPASGSRTNDTTPTYSGTAEADSTVTIVVDGNVSGTAVTDGSGNWSFTPTVALSEAAHTVKAWARDVAGNISADSPEHSFTVDTTPPGAPVVLTPASGSRTNDTTPTYSGTAEEDSTVTIVVDGNNSGTAVTDGSGNWSFTPTVSLSEAAHTVKAWARDVAGNISADSPEHSFTVDTTPPGAPVVLTPASGSRTNDTTPTYSGTAEEDSTVTIVVDGSVSGTAVTDGSGNWSFTPTVALSEVAHTVKARARDVAGTTGPDSPVHSFTVDITPPAAPVVTAPIDGSSTNDPTPNYSGTAEADSTVTIIVDGASVGTTTADDSGDWSFTQPSTLPLSDDPHTVKARARDVAGNISPDSDTHTITIDTLPPAAPFVVTPADNSFTSDTTPDYAGNAEPNSTVTVFVDGAPVGTTTANPLGGWSFTQPSALAERRYTVRVKARDRAGNTSDHSNTRAFTIDVLAPPTPVVVAPANNLITNDPTPTYSGTAEPFTTVIVTVSRSDSTIPSFLATASDLGEWSVTPAYSLRDGAYSVTAQARDSAGNTSPASPSNTFTLDSVAPPAPVMIAPANGSVIRDTTPTYAGTAEGDSYVEVFVDTDTAPVGNVWADASGNWSLRQPSPLSESTPHTVWARATDDALNTSPPSARISFTVDITAPAAPVVMSPSDGSATNAESPSYIGTADPSSFVSVIVDSMELHSVVASDNGVWIATPSFTLDDGSHTVRAWAVDAAGNRSANSSISAFTIDRTPPPTPSLTSPLDGSTTTDTTPTYLGEAEPSTIVQVIVDGVETTPDQSPRADSSGQWSYTSTNVLTNGAHTVRARAIDRARNISPASDPLTFTVDNMPPNAPRIVQPVHDSYTNNDKPTYRGEADPGSTIIVYLNGAPLPDTIRANNTGLWVFTHTTPLTDREYTVKAQARDAAGNPSGNSSSVSFTIDTLPPQAPSFQGSGYVNALPSLEGTAEAWNQIFVSVDEVPLQPVTSNSNGFWLCPQPIALGNGSHSAKAYAVDRAGNKSIVSSFAFIVDTVPPTIPVVTFPTAGADVKTVRPLFRGTRDPNSGVTVTVNSQVCRIEVAPDKTWECYLDDPLDEGTYSIVAIAHDRADNQSAPSAPFTFTITPQFPEIHWPKQGDFINDATPTLIGSAVANSDIIINVDNVRDFRTVSKLNGSWSKEIDQELSEGEHTIIVTAKDSGDSSSPIRFSFTVDLTPPDTSFAENSPKLVAYPPSATFEFSSQEESTFECSLDGADFSPCKSPHVLDNPDELTAGDHTFRVRARDRAGNEELEPAAHSWTRELAIMEGGGCSSSGNAASGLLAGLSLFLLAAAHRRNRSRHTQASKKASLP